MVWQWASFLISLYLCFLVCRMRIIVCHRVVLRINEIVCGKYLEEILLCAVGPSLAMWLVGGNCSSPGLVSPRPPV